MKARETLAIDPLAAVAVPAKAEFWRGVVASFPIMIGLVPVALVLGAQATQKGFGVLRVQGNGTVPNSRLRFK